MTTPQQSTGSGLRDQLTQTLQAVAEQIARLEIENRNLNAERDRLHRGLEDMERRSTILSSFLAAAQQQSQRRVEDAIRQGAIVRGLAERRAAELRELADRVVADAASEAVRIESLARSETSEFIAEVERLMNLHDRIEVETDEDQTTAEFEAIAEPAAVAEPAEVEQAEEEEAPFNVVPMHPAIVRPLLPDVVEAPAHPEPAFVQEAPVQPVAPPAVQAPVVAEAAPEPVPVPSIAPAAAAPTPEPVAAPVIALAAAPVQQPVARTEPIIPAVEPSTGTFELIASPFNSFSVLVAFQKAVKSLEDIDDVRAKSFLNGSLQLSLQYHSLTPIAERLSAIPGFRTDKLHIDGNRVEMLVSQAETAEAGRVAATS